MSDVQNTTAAAETPASEPVVAQPTVPIEEASKPETTTDAPAVESAKPEETVTEAKDESAPAEEKKEEVAAKPIEPISEGQLAVKAPGFIKSIIPAKREFWLSDDAVSSKDLSSYMRGEKAEVSHDVVAWASQTGKGLLFFNKKGESKKQPSHVLALYDATDLKKQAPHEISFKLHNQEHVLKATSDAERDGWYIAIERSIETGKAIKEETRESEGYKAEKEKLDKPFSSVGAAAAAAKRSQSQPKKSTEGDKTDAPERKNSEVEEDDKKDKKPRSTSRGVFDRLKSKKDEKKEEKVEKKPETEEGKPEEEHKTEEAGAGVAAVGAVGAGAAVAEGSSSDDKKEETTETPTDSKTEEKAKPQKRGSIFGKMQAGWGNLKSPQKEKEEKDAELKPEVPPKDEPVSEHPPQIAATSIEPAEPAAEEPKTEEAKPSTPEEKKDATTPSKEKKNFLSSFLPRNRSVSPSTPMKDSPAKTEETPAAAAAEVPKEPQPVEEGKADEAIAETTAVEPLKPAEAKPAEVEPTKTEKRQSVLGSIGRRASKAFKGIQAPKKENTAPATEAKKEETAVAAPAAEEATTNGEVKPAESTEPKSIGDVVPDAVTAGKPEHQPAAVTASA